MSYIKSLSTLYHTMSLPSSQEGRLALTLGAVLLGSSTFLLPIAYRDYRLFKSYGPGGLPSNVFGWFIVRAFFQPFKREMISTDEYVNRTNAAGGHEHDGFLALSSEQLVQRSSDGRPVVGPHAVPQRQLTQIPEQDIKDKLQAEIEAFVARNLHLVKFQKSNLERHANGVFLADHIPRNKLARTMKGEAAHVHSGNDHSLHVVLAPADCKTVIDAGWAQRHGFAGTKAMTFFALGTRENIPSEYILIYAPRTEAEVATVMEIVTASVKNMSGREDVR
ncbi:hypothetical protein N7492_005397 [Penicillium capsulatum]|uniref:Luciferase domain-containing protein n=1 Tax=Penicillium capsulatum TaxID=69766 RepID=A0A9W9IBH6_9EURO|nr:hypothetical protein N7492_005397 [Penicillium capsulatum]